MKLYPYSIITLIFVLLWSTSCQTEPKEKFPFSEKEMAEGLNIGTLLEYAIYDSTKVEFVKSTIGDSLRKGIDLYFKKIFVEINDTIFHHFAGPFIENWNVVSHYLGVVYLDIDRRDSCYLYDPTLVYGLNELDLIMESIAERYNKTPVEILKDNKVGNAYVPKIYFVVNTESMDCRDGFVEKTINIDKFIKDLMREYVERSFPEEEIRISPFIKIRKTLANNLE